MTFYSRRVEQLTDDLYPRQDLTRRVIAAKHFIDRHYSEQIELESIAERAFLSKLHFLRLFKRFYGRTPHQYLTDLRIKEAKPFCAAA